MKARTLSELGAIKAALQQAQREATDAAERKRKHHAREQRERNLFASTVGQVVP